MKTYWIPNNLRKTYPMRRIPEMSSSVSNSIPPTTSMKSDESKLLSNFQVVVSIHGNTLVRDINQGETFIVTESSRLDHNLTGCDDSHCAYIVIPGSSLYPKLGIRIRVSADNTSNQRQISSKLIFTMPPPKLTRKISETSPITRPGSSWPCAPGELQTTSSQPRLYRRFGTDLIPIKLSENINVMTDTVMVTEGVFVSFRQYRFSAALACH
jgi:hypothetical protein